MLLFYYVLCSWPQHSQSMSFVCLFLSAWRACMQMQENRLWILAVHTYHHRTLYPSKELISENVALKKKTLAWLKLPYAYSMAFRGRNSIVHCSARCNSNKTWVRAYAKTLFLSIHNTEFHTFATGKEMQVNEKMSMMIVRTSPTFAALNEIQVHCRSQREETTISSLWHCPHYVGNRC